MRLPRIHGAVLHQLARAARTRPGGAALERVLRAEYELDRLASLGEAVRGAVPLHNRPLQARHPRTWQDANLAAVRDRPWAGTSYAYVAAYETWRLTPEGVARRTLEEARRLDRLQPPMGPLNVVADDLAMADAEASGDRYRSAVARGPLDGVCFAVKEETAVAGLPKQSGTRYRDPTPETADATCVKRLRAAGAVVVGQTPMTELGMTPLGCNPLRRMPRNPHDPGRLAGGSSTGSGVAVATGLVPFALGVDGGGSIRIPSALNGVFGLKPTWGRVSRAGDDATGSVSHVGPIASSPFDLALVLETIGAPDPLDPETMGAPPIPHGSLLSALRRGVKGARIGVDDREWQDASEPVARAGKVALAALEKEGAVLVPVRGELARYALPIGALSIAVETRGAIESDWREHADLMTDDLQLTLAVVGQLGAVEYVGAQRLREGLRAEAARLLAEVDVLALPTTVTTAHAVTDAEFASGFLDAVAIREMCRFCFYGNLTGLPALSMPVGVDPNGLPIGLQFVGDAWDEASVLAIAAHAERVGIAEVTRPRIVASVLG